MEDEKFMRLAIEQALKAKESGEWPFGAVLVKGGQVISSGHVTERLDKTVLSHAETKVVDKACKKLETNKLDTCTIYCTNEPCLMCAAAIFQAKIPRVVIGALRTDLVDLLRDRKIRIYDLAKDSGYEIDLKSGVLRNEVINIFNNI